MYEALHQSFASGMVSPSQILTLLSSDLFFVVALFFSPGFILDELQLVFSIKFSLVFAVVILICIMCTKEINR